MGQNLSKHGLKSFKLVKMVRNVSTWSKKWSESCSQVSKFIEWLKNGKTCFIIGQEWCRECIQTTQGLRMLSTVTLYCQVAKIVMNLGSQL